ncbi:MAG TPA: 3'-5' exonuclease, partial [Candidatus Baltobacteraceae bacterium]
ARAQRIAASLKDGQFVLLTAPSESKRAPLVQSLGGVSARSRFATPLIGDVAFAVVVQAADGTARPELIDDVRAAHLFERAGAELFSLEWSEFVSAEIDPEIAGLRTPERFAAAAYRLIRKLRSAQIDPREFEAICKRGTTAFYGHPPNFASPDLITATQPNYRDSLRVDETELAHQRRREIDLAKTLTLLYTRYIDLLSVEQRYAYVDALAAGTALLRTHAHFGSELRERYPYACVDEAHDLTGGELAFLEALYGSALHGVTFAGDASQATCTFAGARGDRALAASTNRCTLVQQHRVPLAIANVVARNLDPRTSAVAAPEAVALYRATSVEDEAEYVADNIATLVTDGTLPSRIAVIARSVRCTGAYLEALLERNVPLDIAGDANLYEFPAVRDGLALLWWLADPYRHDWLLRLLETPWLALSDASIAMLCGEPSNPQPLLFELPPGVNEGESGRARWDRHRDLRLGRNMTRGDRDADLPQEARDRLIAFRVARARWEQLERSLDLQGLVDNILAQSVPGGSRGDARAHFDAGLIERLKTDVGEFAQREPLGSLHDYLLYVEGVTQTDEDLLTLGEQLTDAVRVLSVEAAKGREFDHVFIVDARASGFARYYVPDAFVFYPSMGVTAKENVGDGARAARTAKFTYAMYKFKTRERYIEEERRAFACAAARACQRLWVSASGRPTRGAAAPEFLEELRSAGLPGVSDITNRWKPGRARIHGVAHRS